MCGIAGLWQRGGASREEVARAVEAMTAALSHRGPDDCGVWSDAQVGLALGQRRLSIIDLSPAGHQPMYSSDRRFVITYNGECYNFADLREALCTRGATFRGHSDTEVIIEGCMCWGVKETVSRLNGMFALAIWDTHERRLYLARDRMGEKPLYWAVFGSLVLFGSELKALRAVGSWRPRLHRGAVAAFLRHSYVPGPFTIYEGVNRLPPGGFVSIDAHSVEEGAYWKLEDAVIAGHNDPSTGSEEELVESLDALLQDSVARRMVSDVPLGAFLSGGYDSSTIVALMQKTCSQPVKTFTISFDDAAFDESKYAEAIALHLHTDHTTFPVSGAEALAVIPKLARMYDEPFADSSQIPTHIVSALTRQHVTVALSGDGGDELFSGYNRYQQAERLWRPGRKLPPFARRTIAAAIRSIPMRCYDGLARTMPYARRIPHVGHKAHRVAQTLDASSIDDVYYRLVSHHEEPTEFLLDPIETRSALWAEDLRKLLPDPIDRMRYVDMLTYLPDDILTKVDRASMAVALEVRVPFLDHRVVEWVWRLPGALNARAPRAKHLLRRVLARYVPERLVERPKMGFGVPLVRWLRGPLREWADALLAERALEADGVFRTSVVRAMWTRFLGGDDRDRFLIWNFLMFQDWHRAWGAGVTSGHVTRAPLRTSQQHA
jgi:asparagine synthase (glutamine-hydrolysing)